MLRRGSSTVDSSQLLSTLAGAVSSVGNVLPPAVPIARAVSAGTGDVMTANPAFIDATPRATPLAVVSPVAPAPPPLKAQGSAGSASVGKKSGKVGVRGQAEDGTQPFHWYTHFRQFVDMDDDDEVIDPTSKHKYISTAFFQTALSTCAVLMGLLTFVSVAASQS